MWAPGWLGPKVESSRRWPGDTEHGSSLDLENGRGSVKVTQGRRTSIRLESLPHGPHGSRWYRVRRGDPTWEWNLF